jgi:hypothetical protein
MDGRESSVSARRGIEVDFLRVGGRGEDGGAEVADSAGFEGAGGLEVVELEEDSASTV